jgi:integrase
MLADMPRPLQRHLYREANRHGTAVWYVRTTHHGPRVRLRAEYGSEAFWAEYNAALAGAPTKPKHKASGSLAWLWGRYRASKAWQKLSPATRRARENIMAPVLRLSEDRPCAKIKRADIELTLTKMSTANQGRAFLDAMRGLFRWAVIAIPDIIRDDPTSGVKNPKTAKTNGFPIWEEAEVDRYQARWPLGTKERVWLDALLYTGLRRGDAVLIGRQHVRDGFWSIKTEKSGKMVEVSNPMLPVLQTTLAAGPTGDLAFICGKHGNPLTKESFGNLFRDACDLAGVKGKSAHGLRKVAATRCAENGATTQQLMALFGWITQNQAELYTRTADRKRMARDAGMMMQRTTAEQDSPALTTKVRAGDEIA